MKGLPHGSAPPGRLHPARSLIGFLSALLPILLVGAEPAVPPVTHVAERNPFHHLGTDPSAHVFADRLWVYVAVDAPDDFPVGSGNRMYRYHALSTEDLRTWTDHGSILHLKDVPWAVSMFWAYDVLEQDGRYLLYFCAKARDDDKGARLGVAIGDGPAGPFRAEPDYLRGPPGGPAPDGIDPSVIRDADGVPHILWKTWGPGVVGETDPGNLEKLAIARLAPDLRSLAATPAVVRVHGAPRDGTAEGTRLFFEGPWVHRHGGLWHLTYPATKGGWNPEHIVAATATDLAGPYAYRGQILGHDQAWTRNFTTHGSIVEFKGRWLFFNHVKPPGATGRMPWVTDLRHRADGSIEPVRYSERLPDPIPPRWR
jgi:beta-xylosidase